jgi:hypothetical protein
MPAAMLRGLLAAAIAVALVPVPAPAQADDGCMAAGMRVDAVYCREDGASVLDRRLEFLRGAARQVMGIDDFDRALDENKGAIEIIRSECARETDGRAQMLCHAATLIDRLYEMEAHIVATFDARLADPVADSDDGPRSVPAPDGRMLTPFLAAVEAIDDAMVFSGPDHAREIGTLAAGGKAVVTGVLMREAPDPSLFRILWQNGTVAWVPARAFRFDPALLLHGERNPALPDASAAPAQRARLACIAAALDYLGTGMPGRFVGPWQSGGGRFYARLVFPGEATFDCVAATSPSTVVSIAASSIVP